MFLELIGRKRFNAASLGRNGYDMKTSAILILSFCLSAFGGGLPDGHREAFGPLYSPAPHQAPGPRHGPRKGIDAVRRWNEIAINASGLDHTPVAMGENRVFGEQL